MTNIDIGGTFRGPDDLPTVPLSKVPTGAGDVFLYNDRMMPEKPNTFVLDLNPVAIKYSRVADIDKRLVKGGMHFQFKRVRKDQGQILIDTGTLGLDYLKRLGSWIEVWMRKNTDNRTGPVLLCDMRDRLYLDVVFDQLPALGRERSAATMGDKRYTWSLPFQIVEDYQQRVNLSALTDSKLIPTPKGSNILYTVVEGDTLDKIAQKIYKDKALGVKLIKSIPSNNLTAPNGKTLKPGSTLICPDVPQETYSKYAGVAPDNLLSDLGDFASGILGEIQNIFETGNN